MRAVLRSVVVGLAGMAFAGGAPAGSFQVSPVRIELAATQPTTVLRVTNTGEDAVTVQAQVRSWSFAGEEDVFADTDDVMLNPPIFTIAPGATQYVRVGLRPGAPLAVEASYRLFLEELPAAPKPGETGVRSLLRLSLPAFVAVPGAKAVPDIRWRLSRSGASEVVLTATNAGKAHVQLQAISLRPPVGDEVSSKKLASYLLPGQTREWKIPGASLAAAAHLDLAARSDAGDLNARLAPVDR